MCRGVNFKCKFQQAARWWGVEGVGNDYRVYKVVSFISWGYSQTQGNRVTGLPSKTYLVSVISPCHILFINKTVIQL